LRDPVWNKPLLPFSVRRFHKHHDELDKVAPPLFKPFFSVLGTQASKAND